MPQNRSFDYIFCGSIIEACPTQEVFGDYIDIYDMMQMVRDGATRPVFYESRGINLNLDEAGLLYRYLGDLALSFWSVSLIFIINRLIISGV